MQRNPKESQDHHNLTNMMVSEFNKQGHQNIKTERRLNNG